MNPKTHAAHPVTVESKYWGANLHIYILSNWYRALAPRCRITLHNKTHQHSSPACTLAAAAAHYSWQKNLYINEYIIFDISPRNTQNNIPIQNQLDMLDPCFPRNNKKRNSLPLFSKPISPPHRKHFYQMDQMFPTMFFFFLFNFEIFYILTCNRMNLSMCGFEDRPT